MKEGLDRLPRMKQREGTELRFSSIPTQPYPPGATPAQITQFNMDRSYALNSVLDTHYKEQPLGVLGEHRLLFSLLNEHVKSERMVFLYNFI